MTSTSKMFGFYGGPWDGARRAVMLGVRRIVVPVFPDVPVRMAAAEAEPPEVDGPFAFRRGIYDLEWVQTAYDVRRLVFNWKGVE
jgi:hypothetical protein